MRAAGMPSLTALVVACARAVTRDAPDDVASLLVPRGLGAIVRGARGLSTSMPGAETALRYVSFGLVDHVTGRTNAIDTALRDALAHGDIRQAVILGAGLDARAHRMPELAGVTLFEIDHPVTQRYKRARARRAARLGDVRYVGVDFERDDLDAKLASAGHETGHATAWIWEGVTPYLSLGAIASTLAIVGRRSRAGSMLAMSYVTRDLATIHAAGGRSRAVLEPLLHPLIQPVMGIIGEPLRGFLDPSAASALLAEHGFRVRSDTSSLDWARASGAPAPWLEIAERLAIAVAA